MRIRDLLLDMTKERRWKQLSSLVVPIDESIDEVLSNKKRRSSKGQHCPC